MKEFFINLFNNLGLYIKEAQNAVSDFEFWIYPIAIIVIIWFLTIIFTKFLYINKKKYKKAYYIQYSWIIASLIIATVIIGIISYNWTHNFYSTHLPALRLSHLISLILSLVIPIITFVSLRKYYKRDEIKEITGQPLTAIHENKLALSSKRAFAKIKIWLLVPALGFLMLLFLKPQNNLLSIVLDTSASMYPVEIEKGKKALNNTFKQLDINADIIFTTLINKTDKEYKDIINYTYNDLNDLNAHTEILNPESAIDYLNNINEDNTSVGYAPGTALTEALWQNYLFTNQLLTDNTEKKYDNIKLIIITDGGENVMDNEPNPICELEFNKIYDLSDITIIDLTDGANDGTSFYNILINECGYDRQYGSTLDDYTFALESAVEGLQGENWFFIIWTIIIYVIFSFIIILINPKKLI